MILHITLGLQAQEFPGFKPLRYDENYAFLKNDSTSNWYKTIKYQPLSQSGTAFISLGGDIRYQYFYIDNETWGDDPKDHDGYILGRYLFHADLHSGTHFRAFVQVQGSTADGRIDPSPVEQNPLDLHQVFIDIKFANNQTTKYLFRLGRQELSYGSQRLISVREGPNNRQSFDALKAVIQSTEYSADVFYSHYVAASDGIFDDRSSSKRKLWGTYFTRVKIPFLQNADFYYLGYQKQNAQYDDGQGKETRHSAGVRIFGKTKTWRYDTEAVYQWGKLSDTPINAWTASVNAGYRFTALKFRPALGMKAELISGDRHNGDKELQTFNPLFPRGAYFGLASVIGPSNLIDLHPSLGLELSRTITWTIDCDVFWRYSTHDGIYAPNGALIYSGSGIAAKEIGKQLATDLVYEPNPFLYFRAECTWFKAGDYLQQAGTGKNILFAGLTMQLKF